MYKFVKSAVRWLYEGQKASDETDLVLMEYATANTTSWWRAGILYMKLHLVLDIYLTNKLISRWFRLPEEKVK